MLEQYHDLGRHHCHHHRPNDRNTVYYTETTRLQDVTLTGTIKFDSNDSLNIMGSGLTLSGGTVHIDNGGRLNFSGTQSLLGTGTVSFTEGSINVTSSGSTTHIAAGIMIDGKEGDIYNTNLNAGSGTIDNQGTIDADSGGGSGFSITSGSGGSWTNDGTLEATAGGHLNLDGTWTNNPGHMISVTGSSVAFNGTWSNQGTLVSQGAVCCLSQLELHPCDSRFILSRLRRQRHDLFLAAA